MILNRPKILVIRLQIILLIASGFFVYSNSLNVKFIWDDIYLIERNAYIKNLSGIPHIFKEDIGADSGIRYNAYRPLQMLTYMLDYSLWKSNVFGYHLTNITLHILVAAIIYWLLSIILKDTLLPFLTSVLFVVHPVHTEAVTYISGRSDPLSSLFILLSIIFYIKSVGLKRPVWYIFMILSYIFALLVRENSLILPFLVLLYSYVFEKKFGSKEILALIGITFIYLAFRTTILDNLLQPMAHFLNPIERVLGFFVAIANYAKLLLFPFSLHMEYGSILFKMSEPKALLGILIAISLLILAFKKKSNKLIFFSISWFFMALLPVSNFFPVNAYMAEHWLYLPSLGFFVISANIVVFLYKKNKFKIWAIFLFMLLFIYYSYFTIKQNTYWENPVTFYERILKYAPRSPRIYANVGNAYNSIGRYEQAITVFKKAIEIEPHYAYAFVNLGNSYKAIGEVKKAIDAYKKAIQIDQNFAEAYFNLGNSYKDMGEVKEAIDAYKKAIQIDQNFAEAYFNLGFLYSVINKKDEAIIMYAKIIEINPVYLPAYPNLITLYKELGKEEEIISLCKKAIDYKVGYFYAYYYIGNLYCNQGKEKEAIMLYQRGIKLDPDNADIYSNLGRAYCVIGKNRKAIAAFKKAIDLNPMFGLAYNNFAIACFYEKQYDFAIEYCDRAIKLGYEVAPKFLELLKPYRK